jgi:hypothetical protein
MLWALGWSIDFDVDNSDGPAHAMTRVPCERFDVLLILVGVALVAAAAAAASLIARAMMRGGWWQVGSWAGFILIADALLMVQYVRFIPLGAPCLY